MASSGTDARPRRSAPPGGARQGSLTGRALILAVVLATLVLTLAVPVRSWFAQRAEIAGLRADVDAARARVQDLAVERERWQDPAFVAAEARRRLHFVLPGEVGYVTLGSEAAITAEAASPGRVEPWYSALLGAVRAADEPAQAPEAPAGKPARSASRR